MVNSTPLLQLHVVSPATPSKASTRACRICVARTCRIPLSRPMQLRGWRIGRDRRPKSGLRLLGGGDQGALVQSVRLRYGVARQLRYGILMTRAEARGAELDLRQNPISDALRRRSGLFA